MKSKKSKLKPPTHGGTVTLLPCDTSKGQCSTCGTIHEAHLPHNQQSLYYQYWFYGQHGRWPTWKDAMEHCTPEIKKMWIEGLAAEGVVVDTDGVPF